jgi:hypothetical protein
MRWTEARVDGSQWVHNDVDITPFVGEIYNDVLSELESRTGCLTNLSEADQYAVHTAVMKGAWRGVLRGIALYTHEVSQAPAGARHHTCGRRARPLGRAVRRRHLVAGAVKDHGNSPGVITGIPHQAGGR